jgi:hypothetical protein
MSAFLGVFSTYFLVVHGQLLADRTANAEKRSLFQRLRGCLLLALRERLLNVRIAAP